MVRSIACRTRRFAPAKADSDALDRGTVASSSTQPRCSAGSRARGDRAAGSSHSRARFLSQGARSGSGGSRTSSGTSRFACPAREAITPATSAYAAIHFAGHRTRRSLPWRSRLAVRDAPALPDTLGIEASLADSAAASSDRLRAEAIAAQPIDANLVVLSSCETASGRIVSGEGIAGLTSAFLAAGAPAAIATLWPVEDATTARLVRSFYGGLARGLPAAEALRSAQRLILRSPATAAPFYWAGFVLVGDGNTRAARAQPVFAESPWSVCSRRTCDCRAAFGGDGCAPPARVISTASDCLIP
jgi:hypothetical protein